MVMTIVRRGVTDFEERTVLDDDIVHMKGLEVGKPFRERDEMGRVIGAVELDELRLTRVMVTGPPEFG